MVECEHRLDVGSYDPMQFSMVPPCRAKKGVRRLKDGLQGFFCANGVSKRPRVLGVCLRSIYSEVQFYEATTSRSPQITNRELERIVANRETCAFEW
jgi:hypothetical protein